jgi:hypothetical protein
MTTDRPVPPYDDRKRTADDVEGDDTTRQGAEVGGARRHRTSDPGGVDGDDGRTASPADEVPAGEVDGAGQEDPGTGPAHTPGTTRGEDQPG